jgi:hypothetical protein
MKVKCIKSSRNNNITEGKTYKIFGVCQDIEYSPWRDDELYFVVFNDNKKWATYPSFLFKLIEE